jgi:hypothetical protein
VILQLGFILGLWYPSTKWAQSVYAKVFSPLVSSYEADIDKLYMDGRTKVSMSLFFVTSCNMYIVIMLFLC